jgi:hypothetical protein
VAGLHSGPFFRLWLRPVFFWSETKRLLPVPFTPKTFYIDVIEEETLIEEELLIEQI